MYPSSDEQVLQLMYFCPASSHTALPAIATSVKDAFEPWPKTILPSRLPTARVLTFGYDAYVADWRGVVSQNRIANHGWNLRTSLATNGDDDTVGTAWNRWKQYMLLCCPNLALRIHKLHVALARR